MIASFMGVDDASMEDFMVTVKKEKEPQAETKLSGKELEDFIFSAF